MTADNTFSRSLHDLGLAAWFGGSLMGAVGLNGAAAEVKEPRQRLRVANSGWGRWTPVNLAGIAARHLRDADADPDGRLGHHIPEGSRGRLSARGRLRFD